MAATRSVNRSEPPGKCVAPGATAHGRLARPLALLAVLAGTFVGAGCSNDSGGTAGGGGAGGAAPVPPYTTDWSRAFTGIDNISDPDRHGLAVLDNGDAVLGGTFWAPIDLGDGEIQPTKAGYDEAFVIALGATDGAPRWNHHWSSSGKPVRCKSLAADAQGHIALIGSSTGPVDFGAGPVALYSGATKWFASFDRAGSLLFARRVSDAFERLHEIAATGAKGFVVVGKSGPSADVFGTDVAGDSAGDALVFSVDSGGAVLWARTIGGDGAQEATHVAASSAGVALTMTSSADIDVAGKTVSGSFVVDLAQDGTPKWTYDLEGRDPEAVAIDASGRIYAATSYANGNKGHLVALDADGNKMWEHALEGSPSGSAGNARGIGVDASGHVFVTGSVAHAIRIDDQAFGDSAKGAGFAGYVLALGADDGAPLWIRSFGGDAADVRGDSVVSAADGALLVKGVFTNGTVDAGSGALDNPGDKADFVVKLTPP